MHCEGKCHLKKEIKQTEEKANNPNKPIPITKTKIKTFPVFLDQLSNKIIKGVNECKGQNLYYLPYFQIIYKEILTPPPEIIV